MQAPLEPGRQFKACLPAGGGHVPAQDRAGAFQIHLNLGTEVVGEPHLVATALDLVDDVDTARGAVQEHRTAVSGRRVERGVATVLGGPPRDVAVIDGLDFAGIRVPDPQE